MPDPLNELFNVIDYLILIQGCLKCVTGQKTCIAIIVTTTLCYKVK